MAEICINEPVNEPISLEDAKMHLKLDDASDEDSYLSRLIKAARRASERYTGRAYITQTWQYTFQLRDFSQGVRLPKAPFQSLDTLEYYDVDTNLWVLMTAEQYDTVQLLGYDGGSIHLLEYPSHLYRATYVAGYGDDPASVPDDLSLAILRRIATMYENRQDVVVGTVFAKLDKNQAVEALEDPYKMAVI